MKIQTTLMSMIAFWSTTALADESSIKCLLTAKGDTENAIAISVKELTENGYAHLTEADNLIENNENDFGFEVVVEANLITGMRLEDKVNNLVSEHRGLERDSYMEIGLINHDGPVKLMCFLNVL